MEQKILDEMRDKYSTKLQIMQKYENIAKRINELEENEFVKEYMELVSILKNHEGKEIKTWNDNRLIESAYRSLIHNIKETNGIYVYIGTYVLSNICDIIHGPSHYKVNRDDPKAEYRIYKNLENDEEQEITINKCDVFEKKHKIIFPKCSLTREFFYKLQRQFFNIAIREGQEAACVKILSNVTDITYTTTIKY